MVFNKSCVLCNGHWCCDGLKHLRSQSRKIKFEQGWSQEALRVVQEKGREMLEDPARVFSFHHCNLELGGGGNVD